ncbi:MAG TPA: hypothetical protein VHO28_10125, partial [Ignavibacteriales bacterium]|nr:hypothetical protein [Ignavibacteriales bacterium]
AAEKFFGVKGGDYSSVIGRTLKFKNSILLTVNVIIKDRPVNTDFHFDVVISSITHYNMSEKEDYETWMHVNTSTNYYVLLREGVSKSEFESRLSEMAEKELPKIPNVKTGLKLQPLSDLHYNAKLQNYNFRVINKNVLFALGLIAALVIIAACINFINLSTAQAVKRSKEAGIKKNVRRGRLLALLIFYDGSGGYSFFFRRSFHCYSGAANALSLAGS